MKLVTRLKKPYIAKLNEVVITRDGETAIIEYKEKNVGSVHLRLGEKIHNMTDEEILNCHNNCIHAQLDLARNQDYVAIEIPPGKPQIEYFEQGGYWTPRGDVLRCEVSYDSDSDEAAVIIDNKEFSMHELGKIFSVFEGWGMRIIFVPEDEISQNPIITIKDPDEGNKDSTFVYNDNLKTEH